jgi:diaminopimelate epimerase
MIGNSILNRIFICYNYLNILTGGSMKFTKMHGTGNDYIYIDILKEKIGDIQAAAVKMSDRHFGIGSDGLVLIGPSGVADFSMRMFNPDGSESEMCGNAIRCVGKYVYDSGMTFNRSLDIETLAGIKKLELNVSGGKVDSVTVNMGRPVLDPSMVPVRCGSDPCVDEMIEAGGKKYRFTAVSMGNPHCIIYMSGIDRLKIEDIGPLLENHPIFPKKANVEFVEVISRKELKMRVWERGTGETLACGTGACAVLVSSVLNGLSDRSAAVKLRGGELSIRWDEGDGCVYMEGPAVKVFEGEMDI